MIQICDLTNRAADHLDFIWTLKITKGNGPLLLKPQLIQVVVHSVAAHNLKALKCVMDHRS